MGPRFFPATQLLQLGVDRSLNRPLRLFLSLNSKDDAPKDFLDIIESMGPRCNLLVASGSTRCLWDPCISPLGPIARLLRVVSADMQTLVLHLSETFPNEGPGTVDLTKISSIDSLRLSYSTRFPKNLCILHPTEWCIRRLSLTGAIDISNATGVINACHNLEVLEWFYAPLNRTANFEPPIVPI